MPSFSIRSRSEPRSSDFKSSEITRIFTFRDTAASSFSTIRLSVIVNTHKSSEGISVLADYETTKVAAAPDFKYEAGKWYHILVELEGSEFVIQFADGPTLYAKHPCFSKSAPSGGTGLGVAGPRGGMVEIDNIATKVRAHRT